MRRPGYRLEDAIKVDLKEVRWKGVELGMEAGKHDNKPSGSRSAGDYLTI